MAIDIPNKVIGATVLTQTGIRLWPFQDGSDDPWWAGGIAPRDYQWVLELDIKPQTHSTYNTREPYVFDGYDISIGDWIANNNTGLALKIISIESKTKKTATIIAEDTLRYNTLRDANSAGNGSIGVGQALIFQINEEGMPLLDPITTTGISKEFFINVSSRFQGFNRQFDFMLTQENNTFEIGDVVAANTNNNTFVKSSSVYNTVIGTVSVLGPGPDDFYINPVQKVVENFDSLIGDISDTIYTDTNVDGKLTLDPTSNKGVYIKLRNSTQTTSQSIIPNATTSPGSTLELNSIPITINGSGTIGDAVFSIEAEYLNTNVHAEEYTLPTETKTSLPLYYGEPGLDTTVPATIIINTVPVTFDIDTVGLAQTGLNIAVEEDMAEALNRDIAIAGNTDLVADIPANNILRIRSMGSNGIYITNTSNDINGVPFSGTQSGSGVVTDTDPETDKVLLLTADDARAINLRDVYGTPLSDYGLFSTENGEKAAALYIEKGLRATTNYVVADIPSRDALTPITGDQAFVIDGGNSDSEWVLYIWDGGQWLIISTQDSAKTDANSLELTVNFDSVGTILQIGKVSGNSRITLSTVTVISAFNGTPTLTIGDPGDNSRLMDNNGHDLSVEETYTIHSEHLYENEATINAYFSSGGATTGQARLVLSYQ